MNKVLLLILDGWGYSEEKEGNAILQANTPVFDGLMQNKPNTLLNASGLYVGLPDGIMGNSEVGHENIGAGRINKQKLTMISDMRKSGEFYQNQVLKDACAHAKKNNSHIHFMGLISEGDVHSHLGHLDGLIELAEKEGLSKDQVFLQAISDGRDDPPKVSEHLMKELDSKVNIATVSGRYWAMDRDNNWERIERYYDCIVHGKGEKASSAMEAITKGYKLADEGKNPAGNSDEFILPTVINEKGIIKENDAVIFFNFRPDRAKQISQKLGIDSEFKNLHYACFTDYGVDGLSIAFDEASLPKQEFGNHLGELVSKAGFNQFRIAETEKYNHVTTFFNSRIKTAFDNEDRKLIPSPKVATYDLKPEMSLPEVSADLLSAMADKDKDYKLIVCNFANPDMVGHTGDWKAVTTALELVDSSVGKVIEQAEKEGFVVMITADHGNADQMNNNDGSTRTAHSCNLVPFILVGADANIKLKTPKSDPQNLADSLSLSNIAPTIVEFLGLEKPKEMTANSLLAKSLAQV